VTEEQEHWSDDLDAKREVVERLAVEFGATFIPLQSIMTAAAEKHGGAEAIAQDGVHPTELGHRIIADEWAAAAKL
jgi:lysophospholipase L1-like esterase